MKKISFKEHYYNLSKLREASEKEREVIIEYEISTYCRLSVFENEEKEVLTMKPKDTIGVKWFIESDGQTKVLELYINENKYMSKWKNEKIDNWLNKNTKAI